MDWFGIEEDSGENKIKSVSEISAIIKSRLDDDSLRGIWIEGEMTNLKNHASGHLYFSLTESVYGREFLINCAMWRSSAREVCFRPENGMKVRAYGSVEVYEPHGKYQFIVRELSAAGAGDKHLLVERWKRELAAEGLFDEVFKKALPQFPRKVGVVSSPSGAARRDIENVISRRYPVEIILSPALVQGDNAHVDIARAIRRIDGLVDVIIVGRGGGSFEDLFPFNHPDVVRAVFECKTPVVSAVGHEIDFTLVDLAADVRAPTPSAAAEIVVPDKCELENQLKSYEKTLMNSVTDRITRERELLEGFRLRLQPKKFEQLINEEFQRLDDLFGRLNHSMNGYIERQRMSLGLLQTSLAASDPKKPLERGYCIVRKNDFVVRSAADLFGDDRVEIILKDGECGAVIEDVNHGKNV
ncbi:exodeoxyribonuclease VII large subunit [Methanolacinia paynteri]|uniref:exodeoxyribonuclease VII large subunit n=1 Tax=Methanolacinia paynteri TaxID=230356 RepID=UPI00064F4CB0|nr:exodeoxyribonuclease VII large subunit [Methanolacinia paynteri]